jgi:hypothetical protein
VEYIKDVDWIEKLLRIVSIGKVLCQETSDFRDPLLQGSKGRG